mgnify:CR=1 FL=1
MKYVALPDMTIRRLPFYLAMEEYVARRYEEELFFMWQVRPTVIFGRNQLMGSEVNLPYCYSHGIEVYRRKSGGGCVYADMDNIMFSYIVPCDDIVTTFSDYTSRIVAMLRGLGLDAASTGRNDILIDGRKVSGNAFYHIPGHSIVHGTMLYSTDIENMTLAISPSETKLKSKGVSSVRSRITTLNEHIGMSIEQFKHYSRQSLCDSEIRLTPDDVAGIERISEMYYTDAWIYGHNPAYTTRVDRRIEGVGEFHTDIEVKSGIMKDINITGDFFLVGDIDEGILSHLRGKPYNAEAIEALAAEICTADVIVGLDNRKLVEILI